MQKSKQWMKLAPVVMLAVAAGACADQSPTEVQSLLESAESPSLAISGSTATSLAVYPRSYTLDVGQVKQLIAVPRDANGNTVSTAGSPVTWSSSNPGVARVDANGRVTAIDGGRAYIRAAFGGVSNRSLITVRAPIRVASIALMASSSSVKVGTYAQLTATPKDASGSPISVPLTWSSSNPGVVRVFPNGLIQAMRVGTATISVAGGGATARINITATAVAVEPPPTPTPDPGSDVASVVVYPYMFTLAVGQAKQMIAIPRSASGTTLSGMTPTWRSSNTAVATVSSNGLLIARAPGTVRITATVEGTVGSSTITVTR